jgi:hypothetical protein
MNAATWCAPEYLCLTILAAAPPLSALRSRQRFSGSVSPPPPRIGCAAPISGPGIRTAGMLRCMSRILAHHRVHRRLARRSADRRRQGRPSGRYPVQRPVRRRCPCLRYRPFRPLATTYLAASVRKYQSLRSGPAPRAAFVVGSTKLCQVRRLRRRLKSSAILSGQETRLAST